MYCIKINLLFLGENRLSICKLHQQPSMKMSPNLGAVLSRYYIFIEVEVSFALSIKWFHFHFL